MSTSYQLPASVLKLPGFAVSRTNREVIVDHLISQAGTVQLTALQERMLERWHAADDIMRSLRYNTREAVNLLKQKFPEISLATAKRDMENARFVFGTSRKASKPYLLALHIERIEAAIVLAERQGKKDVLPKLYDTYTNALKMLPDDQLEERNPSTIIFNITSQHYTQISASTITPAEAAEIAAKRLSQWGIAIEDILHQDV